MPRVLLALLCLASAAAFAPRASVGRARPLRTVPGDDCLEEESCSVEELEALLQEVKSKAEEIKKLETKLTSLTKDDADALKKMLKAEECELNGFDGCSAWYYE